MSEDAEALRHRLDRATAHLDPPFAVIDLDAVEANLADLVRRAAGTPVRLATKSVRCRAVNDLALGHPGVQGVLAYTLAEAIWLVRCGSTEDALVGYPTLDRSALAELAADPVLRSAVTLMVDGTEQAALAAAAGTEAAPVRVCFDLDASLRIGALHLGVRRSPLRSPEQCAQIAARLDVDPRLRVVGLLAYEAQVAGLPDRSPAVRLVKRASVRELATRRPAVVAAVEAAIGRRLDLVNGGGSGSVETTVADRSVTEVSAGSGLFVPTLFDGYRAFTPRPASFFALSVVRRPAPGVVTCAGGGYVASGPSGRSRSPVPVAPAGLRLLRGEGVGEVQTPLRGAAAAGLAIGDRVWFRTAKAGEPWERFDVLHLVRGDRVETSAPTYRGEGRTFG
jgi:D-serine deaminase-like pyridoxal phosphate-dependent protein